MRAENSFIGRTARRNAPRPCQAAPSSFTWRSNQKAPTYRVSDYEALLLAIAGHDLRQPLQVIQSTHEMLGMGARSQSELRLLRTAEVATGRMIAQLDQLLAALRLRHPERIKTTPIQLTQVFRNVVTENQYEAVRKGIKFRVASSRVCVRSDMLLLSAILRNLVRNAVQYTGPGGQVLVGCRRAGGFARIEVHDTGGGIAGGDMPQIFEMFARGSHGSDGHGLGLYIVKQAVEILGHRLEITSAPSRGSRFCVIAETVDLV